MLMQIAEPGESKAKEACKPRVVGIDLGTTNSLVAHVADATPEVIRGEGGALVPSVVHYAADGRVIVGRPAQAHAVEAPHDTIALLLRESAVERGRAISVGGERFGQLVDFAAGTAEHDRRRGIFHVEHSTQRRKLMLARHDIRRLPDPRDLSSNVLFPMDLHAHRIVEMPLGD